MASCKCNYCWKEPGVETKQPTSVEFAPDLELVDSGRFSPEFELNSTTADGLTLGRMVVNVPGRAGWTYAFSHEDALWTARFLTGEAGGRDDSGNRAVIWAMLNRFGLFTWRHYPTFHRFLRAYSTPLQPVLRNPGAARRHMNTPDFVRAGGNYPGTTIPRGQLGRFLRLQRMPWSRLPPAARTLAVRALSGQVPTPIGNATEFGSTRVYFSDKHGRRPADYEEWRRFTEAYAHRKGWAWVGPIAGLDQMGNAFFVQRRAQHLPAGAVRVAAPNGHLGVTASGVSAQIGQQAARAFSEADHESEWNLEDRELEVDREYEQVPLTTPDAIIPGRSVAVVPANACQVPKTGGTFVARALGAITHIVIHMIERSNYASSIDNWRLGGGLRCFKPHYAVSKTGQITQIVAEQHVARHGHGANAYSIGIEHEGFSRNPDDLTEDLYLASAALCRDICRRHHIHVDPVHIIGHDMAPGNCSPGGSCHGDPGGYWDWEYFLALVRWDGISPQTRPIRLIVDTASTRFSVGKHWSWTNGRKTGSGGPHPKHSWSRRFVSVSPDARAAQGDVARFRAVIPAYGRYEVSLWWPAQTGNNIATPVRVDKLGHLPGTLGVTAIAQSTYRVRSRSTRALPHTPVWKSLGELSCVAGNVIHVEVSRRSTRPGRIVADAVRIFRKS